MSAQIRKGVDHSGAGEPGGAVRHVVAGYEGRDQGEAADTAQAALDEARGLAQRVGRLERQNRLLKLLAILAAIIGTGYVLSTALGEGLVVKRTLMESRELKLLDGDGNARLFLRMYSRVPVMQVMDSSGRPRISLGLRFDDSPFLVLSDEAGAKRFSLEMDASGGAALKLLDGKGKVESALQ